jgi:membrane peptidoglycan carboxypeptidase
VLLPEEAALLAAVLPNPSHRDAARPTPGLRRLSVRYRAQADTAGSSLTVCLVQ